MFCYAIMNHAVVILLNFLFKDALSRLKILTSFEYMKVAASEPLSPSLAEM